MFLTWSRDMTQGHKFQVLSLVLEELEEFEGGCAGWHIFDMWEQKCAVYLLKT